MPIPPTQARPTRYAALTRRQAALVLAGLVGALVWFQAGARSSAARGTPEVAGEGDLRLYEAVVERVRGGQGYYDAAGSELRRRGYPVRPFVNWRQPTYAWLLAVFPGLVWGSALMSLLAIAAVALAATWVTRVAGPVHGCVTVVLVTLALTVAAVPEYALLQESWAALFILLSVCCHAHGRWRLAVAAGLAALAFRELALVACVVGLALAVRRGHRPEVLAWTAGLAVWLLLLVCHALLVARHLRPGDDARGWVTFLGSGFLVAAGRWNPLTMSLPGWAIALVLPLGFFGLAGWKDATAARIAAIVGGYFVAFSVGGHPFNNYWGILFAPLLVPFGLPWVLPALRDLARALVAGRATAVPARAI